MYNQSHSFEGTTGVPEHAFLGHEQYAKDIVHSCDFREAFRRLQEEGLLEEEVRITKELFSKQLEGADFLTERDWELLSIINLYSPELAVHSVETYQLVRSKIEHILLGSETIAEIISKENISLGEFFRACLLHDIGKITIPASILNYALAPGDWQALSNTLLSATPNEKVLEHLGIQKDTIIDKADIISILKSDQINPVTSLPVSELLTEAEIQTLIHRGISPDLTLREILEMHELASQQILESEGLYTEATIASQHHNYRREKYQYPITSQTIGINADLADLLRLADAEQALRSERPYKIAFSRLNAYDILISDAEKGVINKELTALWVQHDIEKNLLIAESESDREMAERIKTFVATYDPKNKPSSA